MEQTNVSVHKEFSLNLLIFRKLSKHFKKILLFFNVMPRLRMQD